MKISVLTILISLKTLRRCSDKLTQVAKLKLEMRLI